MPPTAGNPALPQFSNGFGGLQRGALNGAPVRPSSHAAYAAQRRLNPSLPSWKQLPGAGGAGTSAAAGNAMNAPGHLKKVQGLQSANTLVGRNSSGKQVLPPTTAGSLDTAYNAGLQRLSNPTMRRRVIPR